MEKTKKQGILLWKLARQYGHAWARVLDLDEVVEKSNDLDQTLERLSALALERLEGEPSWGEVGGILPTRSHTTATGRLSWIMQDDRLDITLCRPSLEAPPFQHPVTVAMVTVGLDSRTRYARVWEEAMQNRHWEALHGALESVLEPDDGFLEVVTAYCRATRTRGILEYEQISPRASDYWGAPVEE